VPTRADDVIPGYPNRSQQTKRSKKWDAHHDEIEDVGSDETPPSRCEVEADEVVDGERDPNQDVGDEECSLLLRCQMGGQRD
jgi:hypothetical protein